MNNYIHKLLGSHAAWIKRGLDIDEIRKVRENLSDVDPFSNQGFKQINSHLNIVPLDVFNMESIEYLIIDDTAFDGNLNHFIELNNLKDIEILGINTKDKITDLSPLRNFTKLRSLDVEHNAITDLSPLLDLATLEDLKLNYNPIQNLEVLSSFKTLKNLSFIELTDQIVSEILKDNHACTISYCNFESGDCYLAFNIMNETVKVTSYNVDDFSYVIIEITFLNHNKVPIPDEKVYTDTRIMSIIADKNSKGILTYEVHGNVMSLWHKEDC